MPVGVSAVAQVTTYLFLKSYAQPLFLDNFRVSNVGQWFID